MTYSQQYFGKEIHNIELSDVLAFFKTEKVESNKIEFKCYFSDSKDKKNDSEKENDVIKTICGFLNSEGGIIIWGAPIGKKKVGQEEKIFHGNLSPVEKLIEKDSIINRITDSITPSPNAIFFQPIEVEKNKFIYIFEAEKSSYSPHQFKDKYYMRIDAQTRVAPHSYVEALFRKISFPKIEGYLKFENFHEVPATTYTKKEYHLRVNISIWNQSKLQNDFDVWWSLINDVGVFQGHDSPVNQIPEKKYTHNGAELTRNKVRDSLHYGEAANESHTIICNIDKLRENAGNIKLILRFATKNSPMKLSEYNIYVADGYSGIVVINKKVNKFLWELSDDGVELSDAERVNRYMEY